MPKAPDSRTTTTPTGASKAPVGRTATQLPPPIAPVAPDANPWPMPERAAATRRPGRASVVNPPQDPVRIQRHGLSRFVPVAIFLAILGSIATGALRAVERGDRFGAIVPLIVIGAAAIGIWRARRRRRG